MESNKGHKGSPRIREALGRLYQEEGPYFQEYLRRFREDPTSRIFAPLSEAYRRMGRLDDAIAICQEGLSHHPDFYGGRVALARCFLDKREFVLAKYELEKVVHVVPENLLAQKLLGEACLALKEKGQALRAFRMAELLSPSDPHLSQKIYDLEKSTAKDAKEASEALASASEVRRRPTTSELLEQLAMEEGEQESADDDPQLFFGRPPEALLTLPELPSQVQPPFVESSERVLENDFFEEAPGLEGLPPEPDPAPAVASAPVPPAEAAIEPLPAIPTAEELVAEWNARIQKEAAERMPLGTMAPFTPTESDAKANSAAEVWPPLPALDPVAADAAMDGWDDDGEGHGQIEGLLGVDAKTESESFQISHISQVFAEPESGHEITTATLGDLYFGQQQYDKALQIFEKIAVVKPGPEIEKKIQACRVKLGVDQEALVRMRQIKALKDMLHKVKES